MVDPDRGHPRDERPADARRVSRRDRGRRRAAGAGRRRHRGRRAGSGEERRARPTPPGTSSSSSTRTCFRTPTPSAGSGRRSTRIRPDGGLRLVRRLPRRPGRRLAVPEPPAPPRPPAGSGRGDDVLGRPRGGPRGRVSRRGRLRRRALPAALRGGHRPRDEARRRGREDPPRPAAAGHALEALDALGHGAHGLLAARRALGRARPAPSRPALLRSTSAGATA